MGANGHPASKTFRVPAGFQLLIWPGLFVLVGGPLAIIALAVFRDALFFVFAAIALALVAGPVWSAVNLIHRAGARVIVTEQHLEAWPLIGKPTRLRWEELSEIEEFTSSSLAEGQIKHLHLRSHDRGKMIAIDSRLSDFADLTAEIHSRAPEAKHVGDRRRWWQR